MSERAEALPAVRAGAEGTAFRILVAISIAHMLNDVMQSVIPAIYPMLKEEFALDFGQIGLIQLAFQLTASILQPLVGIATDKKPQPFSLAVGMAFTLFGLVLLAASSSYPMLLVAVSFVGVGSSIFHPEASRVARMASGGRTASRNRCSRWAVTSAPRSVRCSPPRSSSATASPTSPGSVCSRSPACSS